MIDRRVPRSGSLPPLNQLGLLASHRGSNMQAVIDACNSGRLAAEPRVVISNNGDAEALVRARREHIPAYHLSLLTHPDPVALDTEILTALTRHQAGLVVLAGYMKRLGPRVLGHYRGRVINIHPALLPRFGGQGMYADRVHAAVLAAGETETGVSVHLVDAEYDCGPILAQCRIPVEPGDTVKTLAERVLACEHRFLVATLERILSGALPLP